MHLVRPASVVPLGVLAAFTITGCYGTPREARVQPPSEPAAVSTGSEAPKSFVRGQPAEYPHLPHLLQVRDGVFSGGEPDEEIAFEELRQLGCRTIISVDGAVPKVAMAKKYGLRYVHIPTGYDGISRQAGHQLAAVLQQTTGPYYVHCHHGKHRGPTAAAILCIAAGTATNQEGLAILEEAGTAKHYVGLWQSVTDYQPPDPLEKLPQLVETADVDTLPASMAQIDRLADDLRACQSAGWSAASRAGDSSPQHKALLLQEAFHEVCRHLDESVDEEFETWMRQSETLARKLHSQLASGATSAKIDATFEQLRDQCRRCHDVWR